MTLVPHIHFVGIGGIGMSGLAKVLLEAGYPVSGCDRQPSHITERLAGLGTTIYGGHSADHLTDVDLLVLSSAISEDNPDLVEARRRGMLVVKRAELLGHLTRERPSVAVAGTHGKTTTTGMIAWILEQAGLGPTIFAGGELINLDTNAKRGQGQYVVVEADEYDYAFLELRPAIAVITNVEADHPDIFENLDAVMEAFSEFLNRVEPDGRIIACVDTPQVETLIAERSRLATDSGHRVITYGLDQPAEWQAQDITPNGRSQTFSVYHRQELVGEFRIHLPGIHNVSNALATIAATSAIRIDWGVIRDALAGFRGARRRFEEKGVVQEITVIDDYAHHPTEVRSTLAAARQRYGSRTIWAVFQPHTYSRTQALLDDFATSFADADHVIVTDIYAARERDTLGVHAEDLVDRMEYSNAHYIADLEETTNYLMQHLTPTDVVLTLGAGDIWKVGEQVLERLTSK